MQTGRQSDRRLWRGKPVRRMHVMVKTIGSLCNLTCEYCYYLANTTSAT